MCSLCVSFQIQVQWCHIDTSKLTTVGECKPWKSETDQHYTQTSGTTQRAGCWTLTSTSPIVEIGKVRHVELLVIVSWPQWKSSSQPTAFSIRLSSSAFPGPCIQGYSILLPRTLWSFPNVPYHSSYEISLTFEFPLNGAKTSTLVCKACWDSQVKVLSLSLTERSKTHSSSLPLSFLTNTLPEALDKAQRQACVCEYVCVCLCVCVCVLGKEKSDHRRLSWWCSLKSAQQPQTQGKRNVKPKDGAPWWLASLSSLQRVPRGTMCSSVMRPSTGSGSLQCQSSSLPASRVPGSQLQCGSPALRAHVSKKRKA